MAIRSKGKLELIEASGNLCRRLSLPRTVGQIYALLFLSRNSLSLDEIAEGLGISKASASTGTRQLTSLGAVRKIWVPGNRRDHFEAVTDLGGLFRNVYREIVKPRLDASEKRITRVVQSLESDVRDGTLTETELQFCQERLQALGRLQKNLLSFAPLLDRIL